MDAAVEFFTTHPAYFALACGVLGLIVGSFLNVVIHRLPLMLERGWARQCAELRGEEEPADAARFDIALPASHCPQCHHPLSWRENIPLVSFLLQRGACRHCGAAIPLRYPLVEALSGVLAGAVAWHFGFGFPAFAALALTWALLALTFIDLDHQLLPDDITLPFLWLGLLISLEAVFVDVRASLIGAAAGYLSLWTVYQLFKWLTKKEGMGYGDFKLLALLGAWLGWQSLPLVIILSSLAGAVVGIALIALRRQGRNVPIPFGPYLAAAGWIALMWGEPLTRGYLRWAAGG